MKKINTKTLLRVAILIAADVVLTRFLSVENGIVRFSFGFVPIALCGMLYGPAWAGAAGGVADLLGATLFPKGAFFPGFTLSAILTGVLFGALLRRKEKSLPRLALAVGLNCLGVSLCLNTLWLTIMFKTPFYILLPTRALQALILIPIQFIVLRLVGRYADRLR